MANPTSVLVTGGRGRVASALSSGLGRRGWTLQVCSRTAGDGLLALDDLLGGTGPLGVDALIHCAWSTVPATAQQNPERAAEVDLPLLQRLIERVHLDPSPPLVVFMSTGAVYGTAPGRPSLESDEPLPKGEYAKGKLAAEQLLQSSGLPHCILRPSSIYSLLSRPDDRQGVIARLVWTALNGGVFQQWGGHSVKDYLHSQDFTDALARVIERRLQGILNVASGVATSLDDLVQMVEVASGRMLDVEVQPAPDWDVQQNLLDIGLIESLTDWKPEVNIEEGLAREVARISV